MTGVGTVAGTNLCGDRPAYHWAAAGRPGLGEWHSLGATEPPPPWVPGEKDV